MSEQFVETVELKGHIIDSLLLPKVLDEILTHGGDYVIKEIRIGQRPQDQSYARIEVRAANEETLDVVLSLIHDHGAVPPQQGDCVTVAADMDGALPGRVLQHDELPHAGAAGRRMGRSRRSGNGLRHPDRSRRQRGPLRADDRCAQGRPHRRRAARACGCFPPRPTVRHELFEFMASPVSSEKPKGVSVREIAAAMRRTRDAEREDPRGARPGRRAHRRRRVDREADPRRLHPGAFRRQRPGHARHRAVAVRHAASACRSNAACRPRRGTSTTCGRSTRSAGSAASATRSSRACSRAASCTSASSTNMPYRAGRQHPRRRPAAGRDHRHACGSDGNARSTCRAGFCLMVATMLHSIATGNLLPAWVKVACVDINPATVTKLMDRGSTQTVGIVTDAEPFLRSLVAELLPS